MFVSVIIPNYNNAQWLEECIESCLDQVPFLKEIIVVDDFSNDESWSILEKFKLANPSIVKIYRNKNKGGNTLISAGVNHLYSTYENNLYERLHDLKPKRIRLIIADQF